MVRGVRIIALLILWLVPGTILYTALTWAWAPVWMHWSVPTMLPSFRDLRVITAGVRTWQEGGDPLIANPYDRFEKPVNYPRVWVYAFAKLGINDKNLPVVGVIFCALFLMCMSYLILKSSSSLEAMVLLVAGLSGGPLLGIERGNNDLFVFALVFAGCVATNEILKNVNFSFAALLKIFPLVALIIHAICRPAKERLVPTTFASVVVTVFILRWRELIGIARATPIDGGLAYGVLSLGAQATGSNGEPFGRAVVICCWLVIVLTLLNAWKQPLQLDEPLLRSKSAEMFCIFGGLYLFSFTVGSNYDYRLIFLLPTLPFAFALTRSSKHKLIGWSYVGFVLLAENSYHFRALIGDIGIWILTILALTIFAELVKARLTQGVPRPSELPGNIYSLVENPGGTPVPSESSPK